MQNPPRKFGVRFWRYGCTTADNVRFTPKSGHWNETRFAFGAKSKFNTAEIFIPAELSLKCGGLLQRVEAGLRDLRVYHSSRAATDANGTDHFAVHRDWEATRCCGYAVG